MKAEDTLDYTLNKYSAYKKFIEADKDFDIPEKISFMKEYLRIPETEKWLASMFANCKDHESIYKLLKIRIQDAEPKKDSEIIDILKDIWIMKCL